jgi:hypothetical protein
MCICRPHTRKLQTLGWYIRLHSDQQIYEASAVINNTLDVLIHIPNKVIHAHTNMHTGGLAATLLHAAALLTYTYTLGKALIISHSYTWVYTDAHDCEQQVRVYM